MKTKYSKPQRLTTNSKSSLITFFLFSTIACILISCQSSVNMDGGRPTTSVGQVYVYGTVDSIPLDEYEIVEGQFTGISVAIIPHKYPCSDSTGSNDAITNQDEFMIIKKSGTYKRIFFAVIDQNHKNVWGYTPCYTAFVAEYDDGVTDLLDYNRILAGPKKLGKDFRSHINPNIRDAHLDSFRIDFVVQDSAKN